MGVLRVQDGRLWDQGARVPEPLLLVGRQGSAGRVGGERYLTSRSSDLAKFASSSQSGVSRAKSGAMSLTEWPMTA